MYSIVTLVFFVHAFLCLLHLGLGRLAPRCYNQFLRQSGLELGPFLLRWRTQRFNRLLWLAGTKWPALVRAWFSVGAVISTLIIVPSMLLLLKLLLAHVLGADQGGDHQIEFQPILPGVNLPLSDLGHYLATLLACSVFHEVGHATAAAGEDIPILTFGVFAFIVLPAAFVDLPTEQLQALAPFQQLRIFAAGVWHNIVLAAAAYLLLFSLPGVLVASAIYTAGEGVAIYAVAPDAPVRGPTGLVVGDVVRAINGCPVTDQTSLAQCTIKSIRDPVFSVCINSDFAAEWKNSTGDIASCCDPDLANSNLCFESLEETSFYCLPVRLALKDASFCSISAPCTGDHVCLSPKLPEGGKLLQVARRDKMDFLYVGDPVEMFRSVSVSDYISATWLLPPWLPHSILRFLYFLSSFSTALAVLNAVPCVALDGAHTIRVIVNAALKTHATVEFRAATVAALTLAGTLMLATNLLLEVRKLL